MAHIIYTLGNKGEKKSQGCSTQSEYITISTWKSV